MSLNDTPSGERTHIGFFGLRNAGKSSLVNAVCNQDVAVVSDVAGTTTDVVRKSMEILPLGPVVVTDTPGIDDEGDLGEKRVARTRVALRSCDIAVVVVDATVGITADDEELLGLVAARGVPFVLAWNKADLLDEARRAAVIEALKPNEVLVSAVTGEGVNRLREALGTIAGTERESRHLVSDLLEPGDVVVLVVPIDESAPKGRLILPQQMVLRDVLDAHASALVCQPEELASTLAALVRPPRIVITDSQAFGRVARDVPVGIALTSFSILMARYKGSLEPLVDGVSHLRGIGDGSRVLISEGCTHHRQCGDIGTVKLPAWIRAYSGANPEFAFTSGGEFPDDLAGYDLVVHCGGCMLNEREMASRISAARAAGVPITNYGMTIAQVNGVLARSLEPFPRAAALL